MRILVISIALIFSSCSEAWHMRRAAHHLEKAGSPNVLRDSTKKTIIIPPKTGNFTFPAPIINQEVTKIDNNVIIKYKRIPGAPGAPDTVKIKADCPGDTVTYYEYKDKLVYTIPPTYKAFIKELLGLSNLEFWIAHIFLGITALLVVYFKLIIPKWPNLKIGR